MTRVKHKTPVLALEVSTVPLSTLEISRVMSSKRLPREDLRVITKLVPGLTGDYNLAVGTNETEDNFLLAVVNETDTVYLISLKGLVTDRWRAYGTYYGYPVCCVEAFINDTTVGFTDLTKDIGLRTCAKHYHSNPDLLLVDILSIRKAVITRHPVKDELHVLNYLHDYLK